MARITENMAKFFWSKTKKADGFTLVELLIVVVIIGILSIAVVVNLNGAQARARDAKRVADLMQISRAMEVYFYEYGEYPNNTDCYDLPAVVQCDSALSEQNNREWIPDLEVKLPVDPINGTKDNILYSYILTRNSNVSTDYKHYYYMLYHYETREQVNRCYGIYSSWSCIGGGNLPR